jgi:hypothetical protein
MLKIQDPASLNNNNLFPNNDDNIELSGPNFLFELIDDNDLNDLNNNKSDNTSDWKLCVNCNVNMKPVESRYRCSICGVVKDILEYDDCYNPSSEQYNTRETTAPLRIVGTDSYRYGRALVVSTAPNYSITQKRETTKQLYRFNTQNKGKTFPIIILKETAELFNQIQRLKVVRRGNGRLGAIAACLDFVCKKNGITKKPKVIADFIGIEESDLSRGDKLLRKLQSEGIIDIPIHHDPISDFIDQYFEKLSISGEHTERYKNFIIELIHTASDKNKCTPNNAQQGTKCAGAVYMLGLQLGLQYTRSDIDIVCDISKATFVIYYKFLVKNRKALHPIFEKYNIPKLQSLKIKKKGKRVKLKNTVNNSTENIGTMIQLV